MEDFVKGLLLAVKNKIISKSLAKAYINAYVNTQFGIIFSDEILKRNNK